MGVVMGVVVDEEVVLGAAAADVAVPGADDIKE